MGATYRRDEAAERAGVEPEFLDRLVTLGILAEKKDGYSQGDVRKAQLARSLEGAGIPLDAVGKAITDGALTVDFLDTPVYERLGAMSLETFRQAHERTGIPLDLLMTVREALGLAAPSPDDRLREDELAVLPFLQLQVESGFRQASIERLLRVSGDALRRITEQEAAWWQAEVIDPAIAAGKSPEDVANPTFAEEIVPLADQALSAMHRVHQAQTWTSNIVGAFEQLMQDAGIHSSLQRLPAICFVDISGFTRLTQELGDDAAADLAATVARLVQRSSVKHGGKPIKWLGDGVMFHFGLPGPGVRAALEMVDALPAAGLPPVHVGLHAGPVLFQEGDYFGQTVNLSARIADYARPGEVLVTRSVVDNAHDAALRFDDVGLVELKGVAGAVPLLRAHLG
jgi:adenylate cyclase